MTLDLESINRKVQFHSEYPLLFASVSGSHLYGFSSPDSDIDVRGVHLVSVSDVAGLKPYKETCEESHGDYDIVTHDLRKFCRLLVKGNGNSFEALWSPHVVFGREGRFYRLRDLAQGVLSRRIADHYGGMSYQQWRFFEHRKFGQVKPLLYSFRALLSGIYTLQTGIIEAHLPTLLSKVVGYDLSFIPPLIERKLAGPEKAVLSEAHLQPYYEKWVDLKAILSRTIVDSPLPTNVPDKGFADLNEFVIGVTRANGL